MKKIVVSILMSALCCSFAFAGCSKPVDDSENTLEIAYYDAGYGYSFIEKWGEKFEAAHPGVSVVLSKSSDVDPKDLLSAGPFAFIREKSTLSDPVRPFDISVFENPIFLVLVEQEL